MGVVKMATVADRVMDRLGFAPSTALRWALVKLDQISDGKARQDATLACALVSIHFKRAIRAAITAEAENVDQLRARLLDALLDGDDEILLSVAQANDRKGLLGKLAEAEDEEGDEN